MTGIDDGGRFACGINDDGDDIFSEYFVFEDERVFIELVTGVAAVFVDVVLLSENAIGMVVMYLTISLDFLCISEIMDKYCTKGSPILPSSSAATTAFSTPLPA